jgi:hypothetical protein
MQQQQQMLKRAVGELIALESILVLPQNMKPVWVTCIVLLGWKTGTQNMCLEIHVIGEGKQKQPVNIRF